MRSCWSPLLGAVAVLVLIGSLEPVARATDAAVLGSFMLVNASLPWLAAHRRTPGGAAMRALDLLLPGLALVLCGWLFLHTGVVGWITAAALGALALVLARYRARPS